MRRYFSLVALYYFKILLSVLQPEEAPSFWAPESRPVTQARADLFVSNRGRRFGRVRFSRLGSAPASRAPASRSNLVLIQRHHRGHRHRIRRRSHRQPGPGRRRTPGAPKDFIKTSQHQLFKHRRVLLRIFKSWYYGGNT